MNIEYSSTRPVSGPQLADVFRRSGIRRPVDDLARMERMARAADLMVTAWDGERLVGVARSLTDFCFCCYLSDLAVDRAYQRQGIGKRLVEITREALSDEVMLLLLAAPTAMSYYPHIGFDKADNAWLIARKR
ncbi:MULTISPECIES: GNAT family N-acetyltransferase [Alicyclobacillus]|uniref:Predicted N-acetyltransferase YhbS n=1 Tax=Alicyclobacillus vulcanalis TaxID=252246 RepID=A0A1N7LHV3_9BACL|nr:MULTISPECIES: GNAT family N-acetyltransferase [Alicyclobacillus]SIS73373.1 Predicted N-acetyltransferase YhbS [Alicyclobacillus vulcanalis]